MTARKDFSQVALDVVRKATGEVSNVEPSPAHEAKRAGGKKGGAKRMASLTEEQRRELAVTAATTRWKKAPAPEGAKAKRR